MKKALKTISCVLLLSAFLLSGCQKQPVSQDTSAWEGYHLTSYDRGNFIETQTGCYKLCMMGSDYYVYYTDKKNPKWMPLCSRADCTHRSSDCNAYVDRGQIGLFDEHIYYVQSSIGMGVELSIWRMELDGSNHEKVRDIPVYENTSIHYSLCFHKGYFIYYMTAMDSQTGLRYGELRAADLKASSEEFVTLDKQEGIEDLQYFFWPYEERLYYERLTGNSQASTMALGQWNLGESAGRILYENWQEPTSMAEGGDCLYMTYHGDGFYRVDKETLERTLILEFPKTDSAIGFTDGEYLYFGEINEFLMEAQGNRDLIIYDTDGKEIQRIQFPDGVQPFYFASTEDKVYFYTQELGFQGLADYYLEKEKIGTDKLEWKRIETVF